MVYITPPEWREELQSIFEDLEQASTNEGDNAVDEEQKQRIKQSFDKIKCVYPHINTLSKLKSTSIDCLLEFPEVCNVLGSTTKIEKRTRTQLSDAIRPCIDSGDNSGSSHWPIVKLVRIFIKSSMLEPGIILVDLPGNSDSNSARSVIAEKYSKDLAVSVVIANITRGISEKNVSVLAPPGCYPTYTIRPQSYSRNSLKEACNLMVTIMQTHFALYCPKLIEILTCNNMPDNILILVTPSLIQGNKS